MRPLLQPELYLNATLRPSSPFWLIPLRASVLPILSQTCLPLAGIKATGT